MLRLRFIPVHQEWMDSARFRDNFSRRMAGIVTEEINQSIVRGELPRSMAGSFTVDRHGENLEIAIQGTEPNPGFTKSLDQTVERALGRINEAIDPGVLEPGDPSVPSLKEVVQGQSVPLRELVG